MGIEFELHALSRPAFHHGWPAQVKGKSRLRSWIRPTQLHLFLVHAWQDGAPPVSDQVPDRCPLALNAVDKADEALVAGGLFMNRAPQEKAHDPVASFRSKEPGE